MAKKVSLKELAKNLDLSVGFLKGISKGEKRKEGDFLRTNTANACRAMAARTGYATQEDARKAIEKDVHLLYQTPDFTIKLIAAILHNARKSNDEALINVAQTALACLTSENYSKFNKVIKQHPKFLNFDIKGAKKPNAKMIDELREKTKSSKKAAKEILEKYGSPNGHRILCKKSAIEAEIAKRVKRWGNTSSMWWKAAKDINPKIKKNDKNSGLKLPSAKTKKLTKMNGTVSVLTGDGISADVTHRAEKINKKFEAKLKKHIEREQAFWAKVAGKQIVACQYLKKMIEA